MLILLGSFLAIVYVGFCVHYRKNKLILGITILVSLMFLFNLVLQPSGDSPPKQTIKEMGKISDETLKLIQPYRDEASYMIFGEKNMQPKEPPPAPPSSKIWWSLFIFSTVGPLLTIIILIFEELFLGIKGASHGLGQGIKKIYDDLKEIIKRREERPKVTMLVDRRGQTQDSKPSFWQTYWPSLAAEATWEKFLSNLVQRIQDWILSWFSAKRRKT